MNLIRQLLERSGQYTHLRTHSAFYHVDELVQQTFDKLSPKYGAERFMKFMKHVARYWTGEASFEYLMSVDDRPISPASIFTVEIAGNRRSYYDERRNTTHRKCAATGRGYLLSDGAFTPDGKFYARQVWSDQGLDLVDGVLVRTMRRDGRLASHNDRVTSYLGKAGMDEKSPILLGVELEVTPREGTNFDRRQPDPALVKLVQETVKQFALVKHDGSVSSAGGFEITSMPATLTHHRKGWAAFFKDAASNLSGWNSKGVHTGLHVHIGMAELGRLGAGKIIAFINDADNAPFVRKIAGRDPNNYAQYDSARSIKSVKNGHVSHYDAVSLSNHAPTLEIRIFRSNTAKDGFFRVLEFVDALCRFAKSGSSMTKLKSADFCAWFLQHRKHYPALDIWMIKNKFIEVKKGRTDADLVLEDA